MTLSTLGSLSIEDLNEFLKDSLETRAKNLLVTNKGNSFYASESINKEIDFLLLKEYIALKKDNLKYEVTPKGREYILN